MKNDLVTLEITAVSHDGMGIGRLDGMAVFVPNTAVGDVAQVLIVKQLPRYCFGKLMTLLTPSPDRIEPDCAAFLRCGGCCYRHISYKAECAIKQQRVADALERIGGLDITPREIIAAEQPDGYRNKAQYPVGSRADGSLYCGFYAPHSHRIVECENGCALQPESFAKICNAVLRACEQQGVTAYDERTHSGELRHIYLRRAEGGDILLCLVVNGERLTGEQEIARAARELPLCGTDRVVGVVLNINREKTNVIIGKKCRTIFGSDSIEDRLCGVRVRINPLSFYQVNHDMAQRLYATAAEFAAPEGQTVLDLYCGAGTIGLSMAAAAQQVIGVEVVPPAVEDAKYNAAINGIENARFVCAAAEIAAAELARQGLRPSVVIVDPPRKGLSTTVIDLIANSFCPERLVYVSCDPATLARDLAAAAQRGYITRAVQPVDMFARTAHVECVALMTKA